MKRIKKRFHTNEQIIHKNKKYECICCDTENAVFAKMTKIKGGRKIDYKELFVVSNDATIIDNFDYKIIKYA